MDSIILDIDGTLWDSTELVAEAWNQALAEKTGLKKHIRASQLKKLFGKRCNGHALFGNNAGSVSHRSVFLKYYPVDSDSVSVRLLYEVISLYEAPALSVPVFLFQQLLPAPVSQIIL